MAHQNSSNNNSHVTIYEPNHILKAGIRVWGEMIREIITFRGLIWRLVVRDISARYRQSLMGVFWAFLTPLVMMFVFVWVRNKNFLPIGDTNMPYAAFVFLGQVVWLLVAQGLTTTSGSLVAAGAMLTKINFPKEVLIVSAVGQTIFEFLLRIPLLVIVFIWTGFIPEPTILLLPVVLLPLVFLVVGLGFILALFNAVLRDISSILTIVINLGMFATPVIYPPPTSWPLSFLINHVNPVSGFIIAARDLATTGYLTQPWSFLSAVILSLTIFLIGWRLMHLVEPKIAERV
ncbi:MAG: ABC transporter permease [Desulfurivibrionaceae bacterium]